MGNKCLSPRAVVLRSKKIPAEMLVGNIEIKTSVTVVDGTRAIVAGVLDFPGKRNRRQPRVWVRLVDKNLSHSSLSIPLRAWKDQHQHVAGPPLTVFWHGLHCVGEGCLGKFNDAHLFLPNAQL